MSGRPHPAAMDVGGGWYLRDAKANLVPIGAIKATDLLMDELVHAMEVDALQLSAAIAAFKQRSFERIGEFQALLAQDFDTTIGGMKGNVTLSSFDGCAKVQIAVADRLELGPELQVAKTLIDECLVEWSADSHETVRAIVNRVFDVDKEGKISHAGLFMLLRVHSPDERWKRAMDAVRESMRVIGSKSYVRYYNRPVPTAAWRGIPLDMASA